MTFTPEQVAAHIAKRAAAVGNDSDDVRILAQLVVELATARADALREAAVVAQGRYQTWDTSEPEVSCDVTACENIATSILALIEKEPTT